MAADEFNIPGWDMPAKRTVKGGEYKTFAELADHMPAADVDPRALIQRYYRHDLTDMIAAVRDAGRPVGWTLDGNLLRWGEPEPSDAAEPVETSETLGGPSDRAPGAPFVRADLGPPVELGPVVWSVEPPLLVVGGRQLGDYIRSLDIRNDAGVLRAIVEIVWPADLPLPEDVELGGCRWTVQAVGGDDGPITFLHLKRIYPEPTISVRASSKWTPEALVAILAEPSDAAERTTLETPGGLTDRAPERRPDTHVWRNFFIPAGSCGWPAGGSGRMLVDRRTWDACIGNGTPEVEPSEVVETEPARLRLTFESGVRVEAAPGAAVGIEEHDEVEGWCPAFTNGHLVVERVARDPDGRTVLELVEADVDDDAG